MTQLIVIFVSVSAFGQTNEVLTNKEGKKGRLSNVSVLITECSPKMPRPADTHNVNQYCNLYGKE